MKEGEGIERCCEGRRGRREDERNEVRVAMDDGYHHHHHRPPPLSFSPRLRPTVIAAINNQMKGNKTNRSKKKQKKQGRCGQNVEQLASYVR